MPGARGLSAADKRRQGLREILADAFGDPSLILAYWLPERGHYVDAEGHRVELPAAGAERAWTAVQRDGDQLAAIIHDSTLSEERQLLEAAGAAAGLALENERLQAELKARVEELERSRQRLIEAGLSERRKLERNLHDGAQQRLVALALSGRRRAVDPLEELTPRERDVLALMAEGRSNRAIAGELVISESAVEKHVTSIFGKLELPATAEDHRRVLAVLTYLKT